MSQLQAFCFQHLAEHDSSRQQNCGGCCLLLLLPHLLLLLLLLLLPHLTLHLLLQAV
jgi:hypothetical protein